MTGETYKKFDVDARIKFYSKYGFSRAIDLLNDYPKIEKEYLHKQGSFLEWLWRFCFGDMNEDFLDTIDKLEKK